MAHSQSTGDLMMFNCETLRSHQAYQEFQLEKNCMKHSAVIKQRICLIDLIDWDAGIYGTCKSREDLTSLFIINAAASATLVTTTSTSTTSTLSQTSATSTTTRTTTSTTQTTQTSMSTSTTTYTTATPASTSTTTTTTTTTATADFEIATVTSVSELIVKQQAQLLSLQGELFNNQWFMIGGGIVFVVIFVILLSYKLKYRNAIEHPPHIQCLLFIFSSLSQYLSRNNPNPSGCTQSIINFLTNTIAHLLTPPTPETAPTVPASTTENSGEELLSVVTDAGAVSAVSNLATTPTAEESDEAFLSAAGIVAISITQPTPTPSPSWSTSSSSLAHIDFDFQSCTYNRCT